MVYFLFVEVADLEDPPFFFATKFEITLIIKTQNLASKVAEIFYFRKCPLHSEILDPPLLYDICMFVVHYKLYFGLDCLCFVPSMVSEIVEDCYCKLTMLMLEGEILIRTCIV
jgi:hypothetical protein